jgi:hypothetical protein
MPKIKLKLNEDSIAQALKGVKAYQKKVESIADKLTHALTEQGVSLAQLNASYMNIYDTGELMRGIESQYKGKVGFVVSTATHSIFCEFGTGIVGAENPHPEVAIAGWRYDVNNHGELGWWYPGRDGKYHWTKGMPSRPFMYDTAQMLRQMVVPLAKEAIK